MSSYQSLVESKLEPQGESGQDVLYICPNPSCNDTSGHLYVNYTKGKWHCFHCDIGGQRIESLLKLLNIDSGFNYEKLYSEQDSELDSIINDMDMAEKGSEVVDYSTDLEILTTYYALHTKPLSEIAYQYLVNRGLTPMMIASLGIREGVNCFNEKFYIKGKEFLGRDYSGRVMVPSLRKDGMVSFYLGRDYIGDKAAKYINPPKELAVASEDVWSLETIETSSVVICEGVFSAIAVDSALGKHTTCATYGKSIAMKSSDNTVSVTSQGEKLLNKKFKSYIMFYDKDALKEAYHNACYLYDRGAEVYLVRIPEEMYGPKADAADMRPDEIIYLIKTAEKFDRFTEVAQL